MATIGTFAKTADGYTGSVRTTTINIKVVFTVDDKNGVDRAPDYCVLAAGQDIGAASRATAKGEGGKTVPSRRT